MAGKNFLSYARKDGEEFAAALRKTLKVWNLESGRELRTVAGHTDWVFGVAVAPDGRHAASASRDNTLKVWDLETGAGYPAPACELVSTRGSLREFNS